jgi:hypothetical protein
MTNHQKARAELSLIERQRRLDGILQAELVTERQRRLDDFLNDALDKLNEIDQPAHLAANRPWWRRLTPRGRRRGRFNSSASPVHP